MIAVNFIILDVAQYNLRDGTLCYLVNTARIVADCVESQLERIAHSITNLNKSSLLHIIQDKKGNILNLFPAREI